MIYQGNNLDVLKSFDTNSVDAVVTDPPYGLSFMGKKWDYDVPSVEFWREVFRVLKPGGHFLSFGGTRTYHRMVVNMEDAGFEIRDQVMWLYGSGFPRSHNVSKGIDKLKGAEREVIGFDETKLRPNKKGFAKVTSSIETKSNEGHKDNGATTTAPATPEAKQWDGWGSALKPANEPICLARKPLEKGLTLAENVLKYGTGGLNINATRVKSNSWENEENLCVSCVKAAGNKRKRTTLETKEYIAQENVESKVIENQPGILPEDTNKTVIGCSGEISKGNTNTNLSTFGYGKKLTDKNQKALLSTTSTKTGKTIGSKTCSLCGTVITLGTMSQSMSQKRSETKNTLAAPELEGRWPSNLILDEVAAELLDEQSGILKSGSMKPTLTKAIGYRGTKSGGYIAQQESSSGGASRFFYVAKASKRERNAGLEGEVKQKQGARPNSADSTGKFPDHDHRPTGGNNHPTVKPIKLMEYLVKLITPPSGVCLDPFMGSGSTGVACKNLNIDFIGIELSEEYFEIAEKRIGALLEKEPLPAQLDIEDYLK